MKLRIQGNSVRLRLTQSEVAAFGEDGHVEVRTRFRPGEYLIYTLKATDIVKSLSVRYSESRINVLVPTAVAKAWVETDQVGMEDTQRIDDREALTILVEKDFKCLHGSADRIDADAFPNPLAEG